MIKTITQRIRIALWLISLIVLGGQQAAASSDAAFFPFSVDSQNPVQTFHFSASYPGTVTVNSIWIAKAELKLELLSDGAVLEKIRGPAPLLITYPANIALDYEIRIGGASLQSKVEGAVAILVMPPMPKPGRTPSPSLPPPDPIPPSPPIPPPDPPPEPDPEEIGLLPPITKIIEITKTGRPSPKVKIPSREKVSIVIKDPSNKDQIAYAGNMLLISLMAEVKPSKYAKSVKWYIDKKGNTKLDKSGKISASHNPAGAVDYFDFTTYPENNSDFGEKTIMAEIPGLAVATPVKIEVFFDPTDTSHPPGKGEKTKTPNWFYYWGQTRAAGGVRSDLKYKAEIAASNRPGDLVIARFDPSDQKVFLSDIVFTDNQCTDRMLWINAFPALAARRGIVTQPAERIDCFGEVIMHEWEHRREYYNWKNKPDWDNDGVPHDVEAVTVGCIDDDLDIIDLTFKPAARKNSWYSCAQRPFNDTTDREINAYFVGWKWPVGKADKEDWSKCGKQWKGGGC